MLHGGGPQSDSVGPMSSNSVSGSGEGVLDQRAARDSRARRELSAGATCHLTGAGRAGPGTEPSPEPPRRAGPADERGPSRRRSVTHHGMGAHPGAHRTGREAAVRPERQRQRDRHRGVEKAPQDPRRAHRDDGPAPLAAVSPLTKLDDRRARSGARRAPQVPSAKAVTVKNHPLVEEHARGTTGDAPARTCRRNGWRGNGPGLDVDRGVDDS